MGLETRLKSAEHEGLDRDYGFYSLSSGKPPRQVSGRRAAWVGMGPRGQPGGGGLGRMSPGGRAGSH